MSEHVLSIKNLTKQFDSNGSGIIKALDGFSLEARPGEFVVIVGPNGSGKTTALNLIAGDYSSDKGSIRLQNNDSQIDITNIPRWKRSERITRVYQDPKLGTIGSFTVYDNLRLALSPRKYPSPFAFHLAKQRLVELDDYVSKLGLKNMFERKVSELSQGQRQIFAVLLAIVRKPDILLLDEHTASLDHKNATKCLKITEQLCRETKTTVIMVTHNMVDAVNYGDMLIVLRDGKVAASIGKTEKQKLDVPELFNLCGYSTAHIDPDN